MAWLRMFAAAREAAGTGRDTIDADSVGEALSLACERYGQRFARVLAGCRVWVNGQPADPTSPLQPDDELAVLPPVSGGC